MNLYDDLDTKQIADWSSGLKLLQPTLKVNQQAKAPPKKTTTLTPVINLKTSKSNEPLKAKIKPPVTVSVNPVTIAAPLKIDEKPYFDDWEGNEYDPSIPNEYDKIIKERRERRDNERKRHKNDKDNKYSGFGGRHNNASDEEEDYKPASNSNRGLGAQIAPPPSLQENVGSSDDNRSSAANINTYGASSVAAKIMAKYGFKDGQGLGKQEQGMSIALQVEKTSKRGGRIIHEKDGFLPAGNESPPFESPGFGMGPPPAMPPPVAAPPAQEPSITELLKNPSKIVLLRNMVGPGDVDADLEPEVKDECNTKYGDVVTVVIKELPNKIPEETVRIFVEFKRIESAIKAVVDLNGRFFGGRKVMAGFYSQDKFENYLLYD